MSKEACLMELDKTIKDLKRASETKDYVKIKERIERIQMYIYNLWLGKVKIENLYVRNGGK